MNIAISWLQQTIKHPLTQKSHHLLLIFQP